MTMTKKMTKREMMVQRRVTSDAVNVLHIVHNSIYASI